MRLEKILFIFILSLVFILQLSVAAAQNKHLTLLAVSQLENGSLRGSVADLLLEVREGSEKIYLDIFPLSKLDTQLSIRFAKDVACKFAQVDCSIHDFLYTIRADTEFIGGPSAGAAISVITFAQLKNLDLNDSVAITGTINSGRLVGNVGGVKEKIEGAAHAGIKKVLIPPGERNHKVDDNTTIDLVEYGRNLSVEVVPVLDLEEALYHFTGINYKKDSITYDINENYTLLMKNISDDLCGRSYDIINLIEDSPVMIDNTSYNGQPLNETYSDGLELLNDSNASYANGSFYSSSSQCFAANIKLYYVYLMSHNYSDEYYQDRIKFLQDSIGLLVENITSMDYDTITALQTTLVVRQRLEEAQEYLDIAKEVFFKEENKSISQQLENETVNVTETNRTAINTTIINATGNGSDNLLDAEAVINKLRRDNAVLHVALTIERLKTVGSWSQFYKLEGQKYEINSMSLRESCNSIIEDVKSRIQYARLYLPNSFTNQEKKLKSGDLLVDPLYCLSEASTIRADVNSIISSFGIEDDGVQGLIGRKLQKASEIIAEETSQGRFPILGYSYLEYSKTLKDVDPASSLIYSEYALELSNLDLYFQQTYIYEGKLTIENSKPGISFKRDPDLDYVLLILVLLFGIVSGMKFSQMYYKRYYSSKNDSKGPSKTSKRSSKTFKHTSAKKKHSKK